MVPLVSLVYTVLDNGLARLDSAFFTNSMFRVVGEGGGAYHAIVGTVIVTVLATLISVPIGLMTAIYLVEYGTGRLKRGITFFVDVMTGIPSIVAGLFAFALFTLLFGNDVRMGVMGAVALSVLMIPVVVRLLRGSPRFSSPTSSGRPPSMRWACRSGGRSSAWSSRRPSPAWERASRWPSPASSGRRPRCWSPSGFITSTNFNPFDGRMATLPVFAYYQLTQPGTATQAFLDRPGRRPRADHPGHVAQRRRPPDQPSLCSLPRPVADRPDQEDIIAAKRIEVSDLDIYYGSLLAVQGVNLSIEPCSITALIGPSGCGKSTSSRSLNCMHEVIPGARVEGKVVIDGQYASDVDPVDVRRHIGMVFQRPNLFPTMSIYDNVAAGLRLNATKMKKSELDDLVERSLRGANLWAEVKDRLAGPARACRAVVAALHRPRDRRRARRP